MRLTRVLLIAAALAAGGCNTPTTDQPAKKSPSPHLVETAAAHLQRAPVEVERNGTLTARRSVRIITQEEGRLVALPHFEGDAVKAGEELFRLDDSLLAAELKKSAARRRQAELDLQRLEKLKARQAVAEEELARAGTELDVAAAEEHLLQVRLGYARVRAPFAGVVSARRAEPGDVVPRFSHLITLIDPNSLVTELLVSELLLPHIGVGDTVEVRIDALGRDVFPGRVLRIHPQVDAATRLGTLEVELTPPPAGALPGQLCRVRLQTRPVERLSVPFEALRRDASSDYVFVVDAEGRAHQRTLRAGMHLADGVEVLEGLSAGERVVVKGFLGLADGKDVQPVERSE